MEIDVATVGLMIGETVKPFTGCIFAFPKDDYDPTKIKAQGSCGFIKIKEKRLIITASHVLSAVKNNESTGVVL